MSPDQIKKLQADFPLLYRNSSDWRRVEISAPVGWFDVIYRLSADITKYVKKQREVCTKCAHSRAQHTDTQGRESHCRVCRAGFIGKARSEHIYTPSMRIYPYVRQIKTKFGSLRFYVSESDVAIRNAIGTAEADCDHTCTVCGAGGGEMKEMVVVCKSAECNKPEKMFPWRYENK